MKFTLSWLKDFLDTNASLEEITNKLTMLGLEVEEVIDLASELADFEVAEIIEAVPHPNADKLRLCKVKTSSEILNIVCGAPNARSGIKVVLAKIGTTIPNGNFKIKQSKIRGVDSCGMLCSAEELNIKGDSSGIIELPEDVEIGTKIAKYFGFDDPVIHINITPNRADGLGVYGVARDLAAAGIGTLKALEIPKINDDFSSSLDIKVLNQEACSLFAVREIKDLSNTESPKWLKNCLESIGVGSISPVVDVTNYISYSFGQPMHAYDADKVDGGLVIDTLKSSDKILALNDREYKLQKDDLVIRDEHEIHCLAGIIGGKSSSCSRDTKRILLESACFDSQHITRSGRRLGIETDSRYRFERNVDQEFSLKALDYATNLILTICGGKASAIKSFGESILPIRTIDFSTDFFFSRAGFKLSSDEISGILERLGFKVDKANHDKDAAFKVTIPSWRSDVSLKEDLVEEVLRIYGYEQIPLCPLPDASVQKIVDRGQKNLMDVKRLLAVNGYTEVVSWSFMDSKKASFFSELKPELMLLNPISSDLDYMRPSILPNLLRFAANNLNRSFKDLSLFELGPVFLSAEAIIPVRFASGVRIGNNLPKNCHSGSEKANVFDVKADLEVVLANLGFELDKCQIKSEAPSYYHPTRSGAVSLGKNLIAYFGQVHPSILKLFDIEQDVMAFELNLSNIPKAGEKFGKRADFKASDYQMINRDYAFIIDEAQSVGEILSFIRNADKNLIKNVSLFDVYVGDKIEKGKKSVAISVLIQDDNKTLTEEDISHVNKIIIAGVEAKFNAHLREI